MASAAELASPDGTIKVNVAAEGRLSYVVKIDDKPLIVESALGLRLRDGAVLGRDVELLGEESRANDSTWENRLGKRRTVRDRYNELRLILREKSEPPHTFEVVFRAYDDGVAFRYLLPSQDGLSDFVVEEDLSQFSFPENFRCYAGDDGNKFRCSQEWEFRRRRLIDIAEDAVIGLPVLVETPAAWVAIAEADLLDWSGMWIGRGEINEAGGVTLRTKLAPRLDGEGLVKATAPHQSSWRVLMIAREPGRLVESEIIHNLSTPTKIDASWVKPGMMAWDHWWSGDTIMDTATIKSYIQLAADMGWEYQLIDWQWYGEPEKADSDITTVIPALDMDEVRRFAAENNVRLWLWLHWTDVDRNDAYKKAFPLYKEWGIAGVKIDFMDRDDQEMVNWYEKITKAAADHHLMVNFHGAFKTSGFDRTYPNQVTREGILGNEYNKWSERITPEHKLMLPFTRFLEGPADFTPGGFLNRQPSDFKPQKPALVQGTRGQELALLVVYDSPVCCMCDHPDHYRDEAGVDFLKVVPTVWDETKVLDGVVGEQIVVARQSGSDWYLGAMTVEPRTIDVDLDFLGEGFWKVQIWKDGKEASAHAEQLVTEERTVSADDTLTLKLAKSGGCVARFVRTD
jgi:alpha-glucosidase